MTDLTEDDYALLTSIFQDPVYSYYKIAKGVKLSSPTVKKKVEMFRSNGLIKGFYAEYYPEALGLESHIFLLSVESKDKLHTLEKILQLHPYFVQSSRCYGAINGLVYKIHIPTGSYCNARSFLNYLKDHGLIKDIVHSYYIGKGIKTKLDLNCWNPESKVFDKFEWTLWEKNIDVVDYVPAFFSLQEIMHEKPPNVLSKMRYNDFLILKEILNDTTKRNKDIAKELDIPEYTVSRRRSFLENKVIRNYLIKYDPSFFGLQDDLIFKAICGNRALTKIVYLLQNLPLPFDSDFRQTDDGFLWKILLPPRDRIKLIDIIWSLFPELQIMVVDSSSYISKGFDPHNFSFSSLSWRDSYDYMVKQVIEKATSELLLA